VIVDNYDSFTYNLSQMVSRLCGGRSPIVLRNDEPWARVKACVERADAVVIGPGPGHPEVEKDFGVCAKILDEARARNDEPPILGVCLGLQGMATTLGGKVVRATQPMHGRLCGISHKGEHIFKDIPQNFKAVRYNSLVVSRKDLPQSLEVCAWAANSEKEIMGLRHKFRRIYGVQFHPESICTEQGSRILKNFLEIARNGRPAALPLSPPVLQKELKGLPSSRQTKSPPRCVTEKGSKTKLKQIQWYLHYKKIEDVAMDAPTAFQKFFGDRPISFWLDSSKLGAKGSQKGPRFSYMGVGGGLGSTLLMYNAKGREIKVSEGDGRGGYETVDRINLQCREKVSVDTLEEKIASNKVNRDLFSEMQRLLESRRPVNIGHSGLKDIPFEFDGGMVGYIGYEAKSESLKSETPSSSSTWRERGSSGKCSSGSKFTAVPRNQEWNSQPDACILIPDRMIVYDHQENAAYVLWFSENSSMDINVDNSKQSGNTESKDRIETGGVENERAFKSWGDLRASKCPLETADVWARKISNVISQQNSIGRKRASKTESKRGTSRQTRSAIPRWNPKQYLERISRCKELIKDGETYELCLTNQLKISGRPVDDPLAFYMVLRQENPAPYAAYFSFRGSFFGKEEFCILSSSPERFIRVSSNGAVESKPIKGTRPRGKTEEEDVQIVTELKSSEKDFAENLMIVDLTRNDLGRVCVAGSVRVPKLMHVESYATVHQLVSTVSGVVSPSVCSTDIVRAAFPPGSMTGAPKQRSTELLHVLEGGRRGIYSGCIGFFGFSGAVDLNVVIRTVIWTKEQMTLGTGGAIVHMSEPNEEHDEMLLKTRAIFNALSSYDEENEVVYAQKKLQKTTFDAIKHKPTQIHFEEDEKLEQILHRHVPAA